MVAAPIEHIYVETILADSGSCRLIFPTFQPSGTLQTFNAFGLSGSLVRFLSSKVLNGPRPEWLEQTASFGEYRKGWLRAERRNQIRQYRALSGSITFLHGGFQCDISSFVEQG